MPTLPISALVGVGDQNLADASVVPTTAPATDAPDAPAWLMPAPAPAPLKRERALRHLDHSDDPVSAPSGVVRGQYSFVLETMLDRVREGTPLRTALAEDPRRINIGDFMAWVMQSPQRRERYHEAQEVAAEIVAADLIPIADGKDSIEDVSRSALRVSTRRELLKVWSRKRYGDVKQLDVKQESNFTFTLTRPGDPAVAAPVERAIIDAEHRAIDHGDTDE